MASCRKVKPNPNPDEEYILRLTKEEAITLKLIGWRVGGALEGRRGDINKINDALISAGISDVLPTDHNMTDQPYSGITFNPVRTDPWG